MTANPQGLQERLHKYGPCNLVGGNDYIACTVCFLEYDYRKVNKPPCGLASALDSKDALLADAVTALETVQKENKRARREFTNVSNNLISKAIDATLAKLKAARG